MTRSLKVRSECMQQVELAVKLNGFPSQRALAEDVGLASSTISNFMTGKPVDRVNFLEICLKLGLDWKEIADLQVSPAPTQAPGKSVSAIFISYCAHDSDAWLAQEFYQALKHDGHQVFLAGQMPPVTNGVQEIDQELMRCDYLLLLLSPKSTVSEMVTEQVRQVRKLRYASPERQPVILIIRVGLSWNVPVNHDLRGYLHKTWQREWQPNTDTSTLIREVRGRLQTGDFPASDEVVLPTPPSTKENLQVPLPTAEPELPGGQVDLASTFYLERPPIEARCHATIRKPGALIRIKAPRQMGKTSLMARILHQAAELGYLTVPLSFQLADSTVFTNLDKFLQWFCASISWQLELPDRLTDYWSSIVGSKMSCTTYFERYLLPKIASPLVLGLDEVDLVFQYREIAGNFFGLLRAWHEYAKNRDSWKKLRLVVVHSTEVYLPLSINQSPFNVGLPIELPEFTTEQVHDLAQRHQLNWATAQVEQLMAMVGGHPFLVRVALYWIAQQEITLEHLLLTATSEAGIYSDHLRRHLWTLAQHPELATAVKRVVSANEAVRLEALLAFRLHSTGLVHLQGNYVMPRCALYRQYLYDRLGAD